MTTAAHQPSSDAPQCWCCGAQYSETALVRLGQHPEVGICFECAHWLRRRATARHDEQHPTPAGSLRRVLQAAREHVIDRGWHQRRPLGPLLRRIDHHLP